jgi:hypothetical protein
MRHTLTAVVLMSCFAAGTVLAHDHSAAPAAEPAPAAAVAPATVATPATEAVPAAEAAPAAGSVAPGDTAALKAAIEASAADSLMGTAMEEHAQHLVALLDAWGDAPFADVLETCSSAGITSTQGLLEYAGASRSKYRKTFSVKP